MTNLMETKMNEAAQQVEKAQLKRLLRKAQELGRHSETRIKELRLALMERTREVANLSDSLRSQEHLLGDAAAAARELAEAKQANTTLHWTNAALEETNKKQSEEIASLLFSLNVEEQAHVTVKQELDRIPRWVRRLFRAKGQAVRSETGEDYGGGPGSGQ